MGIFNLPKRKKELKDQLKEAHEINAKIQKEALAAQNELLVAQKEALVAQNKIRAADSEALAAREEVQEAKEETVIAQERADRLKEVAKEAELERREAQERADRFKEVAKEAELERREAQERAERHKKAAKEAESQRQDASVSSSESVNGTEPSSSRLRSGPRPSQSELGDASVSSLDQNNRIGMAQVVWITPTGKKFHAEDCSYSKIAVLKEHAVKITTPCFVCGGSASTVMWDYQKNEIVEVSREEIVYVTATGFFFHSKSCNYGKIAIPKSDVSSSKTPCKKCKGTSTYEMWDHTKSQLA